MCDPFLFEICKLHISVKCKACDLNSIFASRLFLIRSSHVCVTLAEYRGSCSNVFYRAHFCFLHDIILKEGGNIKCKQNLNNSKNQFWKFYPFIVKIFFGNNFPKQYAQSMFSDCFMHENFKIIYNGQSCQTVHRCIWKSYSDECYRKAPVQESLF